MGWKAQYHAYVFRPESWSKEDDWNNDWIGPKKSTANDAKLMLNFYGGGFVANSAKIELGQVLNTVGSKLEYVYDLGDHWLHDIELLQITTRDQQVPFQVLEGWYVCFCLYLGLVLCGTIFFIVFCFCVDL